MKCLPFHHVENKWLFLLIVQYAQSGPKKAECGSPTHFRHKEYTCQAQKCLEGSFLDNLLCMFYSRLIESVIVRREG